MTMSNGLDRVVILYFRAVFAIVHGFQLGTFGFSIHNSKLIDFLSLICLMTVV